MVISRSKGVSAACAFAMISAASSVSLSMVYPWALVHIRYTIALMFRLCSWFLIGNCHIKSLILLEALLFGTRGSQVQILPLRPIRYTFGYATSHLTRLFLPIRMMMAVNLRQHLHGHPEAPGCFP